MGLIRVFKYIIFSIGTHCSFGLRKWKGSSSGKTEGARLVLTF